MKPLKTMIMTCVSVIGFSFAAITAADKASEGAAEKLLDSMNMEYTLAQSIEQMLNMQLQQNPAMAPYKGVMSQFLKKHMSYDSLKSDMVKLYAEAFSATELNEITAFYKTDVGKKTIKKMPSLMAAGGQIGAQKVQANMPELQAMIQAESERLQQEEE